MKSILRPVALVVVTTLVVVSCSDSSPTSPTPLATGTRLMATMTGGFSTNGQVSMVLGNLPDELRISDVERI